jgi:hypothetical protein
MYVHIGNGESVRDTDIIGIFDLDTSTISKITKRFISEKEKKGLVEYSDFDLPRAFILTKSKKKEKIILTRISSVGLKQRIDGDQSLILRERKD